MWEGVLPVVLIGAVAAWLLRGRRRKAEPAPDFQTYEDIEAAEELRRAEDEVRHQDSGTEPDEERPGDDWGPGTAQSYR